MPLLNEGSYVAGGTGGGGGGSVTSVGLTAPTEFVVGGSPVTTAGTLTLTKQAQAPNLVYASPNGGTGVPVFRSLVGADLPTGTPTQILYYDGAGKITGDNNHTIEANGKTFLYATDNATGQAAINLEVGAISIQSTDMDGANQSGVSADTINGLKLFNSDGAINTQWFWPKTDVVGFLNSDGNGNLTFETIGVATQVLFGDATTGEITSAADYFYDTNNKIATVSFGSGGFITLNDTTGSCSILGGDTLASNGIFLDKTLALSILGASNNSISDSVSLKVNNTTGGQLVTIEKNGGGVFVSVDITNETYTLNKLGGNGDGIVGVNDNGLLGFVQSTGWSANTATPSRADFDAATVTLTQLAQRVAALIQDLESINILHS